jgi:hypothetical protein
LYKNQTITDVTERSEAENSLSSIDKERIFTIEKMMLEKDISAYTKFFFLVLTGVALLSYYFLNKESIYTTSVIFASIVFLIGCFFLASISFSFDKIIKKDKSVLIKRIKKGDLKSE